MLCFCCVVCVFMLCLCCVVLCVCLCCVCVVLCVCLCCVCVVLCVCLCCVCVVLCCVCVCVVFVLPSSFEFVFGNTTIFDASLSVRCEERKTDLNLVTIKYTSGRRTEFFLSRGYVIP